MSWNSPQIETNNPSTLAYPNLWRSLTHFIHFILPYYHYKGVKDISDDNLKYTKIATEYVGIEGGGGYYDANSGGYDVLGLGTLMYAR